MNDCLEVCFGGSWWELGVGITGNNTEEKLQKGEADHHEDLLQKFPIQITKAVRKGIQH